MDSSTANKLRHISHLYTWLATALTCLPTVNCQPQYVAMQTSPSACEKNGTEVRTCYTLYGRIDDQDTTWQEAFHYCRSVGGQLAVISSNVAQTMLGDFTTSQRTGNGHAWIAARRDEESETWQNVIGEIFKEAEVQDDEEAYCAVLYPDKSGDKEGKIKSRHCYHSAKKALCQRLGSFCDGYYSNGYCYSLSPTFYTSWYEARTYCISIGGDLAHCSLTCPQLLQSLDITSETWIGVVKQPWTWFYADGSHEPLTFDSWRSYEGAGRGEDCAHIELNDGNNWSDKSCRLKSKLFVCETGTITKDGALMTTKKVTKTSATLVAPRITTTNNTASTTTASAITVTTSSSRGSTTTSHQKTTRDSTTTATTISSSSSSTSFINQSSTTANSPKTPFSYEDIFNGNLWPSGYYGYFSDSGDDLIYRDEAGDVYKEELTSGTKTVILPSYVLSDLNSWTYFISPSYRYVLIGYDRTQLYRYSFTARYKIYDTQSGSLYEFPNKDRLAGERLQIARWGKGDKLSFVYENNLYYQRSPQSEVVQVTSDGARHYVINGVPDWMYEEDIIWSNNAHYWSPSGRYLCYAKFNITGIPLMKIPVYGSDDQMYPDIMEFVYPKAGDTRNDQAGPTTRVELFVIDTKMPSRTPLKLLPPMELSSRDHYYTTVVWRDDATVYTEWTNRAMNKSVAMLCTVDSMIPRCVRAHEVVATDAWIVIPATKPIFIDNAQYYLTILPKSVEGHGQWQHLAIVKIQNSGSTIPLRAAPVQIRFLTDGNQEITDIVGYDERRQIAYYTSTNGDPSERHLFSVGTAPMGPGIKCLTCDVDNTCLYVDVSFSSSGKYYIQSCRGPGIPKFYLKSTDHRIFRTLESNEDVASRLSEKLLPSRYFTNIQINDKFVGKGEIWLPPNFNPNRKYRHIHYVYGAPDSQQVFKEYMLGGYRSNWFIHLASTYDVVITKMDGRGSYGNGDDMRHAVYKKLGVVDVEDQIKAARYFKSLPFINSTAPTAVAGWSFGGKLSSLSLVDDSNTFQCGLAISPETNTKYYDSAYSERYLGFANESMEAYDNTDVIRKADKFKDKKFFLAHGTKDDNVHFVHSAQLIRALTEAEVQFKSIVYTDENHNLAKYHTLRHIYKGMTDFLVNDCWAER